METSRYVTPYQGQFDVFFAIGLTLSSASKSLALAIFVRAFIEKTNFV
jgi:hypothetical protein